MKRKLENKIYVLTASGLYIAGIILAASVLIASQKQKNPDLASQTPTTQKHLDPSSMEWLEAQVEEEIKETQQRMLSQPPH